jgi:iron complex outermembrane recepter protein
MPPILGPLMQMERFELMGLNQVFTMRTNVSLRAAIASALSVAVCSVTAAQEARVEQVIVTSTALHENPLEVAQPTEVVSGDELRRQVAASLGETLSGELGVSSTYFGPSSSQPVIRGLGGYRVQVLQDGAAALDASSLSQDHAVSIESVVSQQIEIIKGPAALLYGSGAAGGLVNVVTTRIPQALPESFGGALEIRGDSATEQRTGAASIDGGFGPFALHADYFDRETDDVEIADFAQSKRLRRELEAAGEEITQQATAAAAPSVVRSSAMLASWAFLGIDSKPRMAFRSKKPHSSTCSRIGWMRMVNGVRRAHGSTHCTYPLR